MLDYNVYHFTKKELVYEIVRADIIVSFAGILFFENIIGVLMLLPFAFFLVKDRKKKKREERLFNLRNDFKEFLASFSSSVQAGYTMEQSIMIGLEDLKRMYPEDERAMIRELSWMYQQLKLQISCDELFSNLAERTGLEEIRSFSVILGIGRKQGGNLVQITRRTAVHMNRKIQVEMEMEQAVAALALAMQDETNSGAVKSMTRGDTSISYDTTQSGVKGAESLLAPFRRLGRVQP
jgi:tight adherence protein B